MDNILLRMMNILIQQVVWKQLLLPILILGKVTESPYFTTKSLIHFGCVRRIKLAPEANQDIAAIFKKISCYCFETLIILFN